MLGLGLRSSSRPLVAPSPDEAQYGVSFGRRVWLPSSGARIFPDTALAATGTARLARPKAKARTRFNGQIFCRVPFCSPICQPTVPHGRLFVEAVPGQRSELRGCIFPENHRTRHVLRDHIWGQNPEPVLVPCYLMSIADQFQPPETSTPTTSI